MIGGNSYGILHKLWHELLRDNLTACGYKYRPNDTTTWKRIERKDGKTAAVAIILVFVDDFMHIWKTYAGSDRIRDKLHADLRTKGLPPSSVAVSQRTTRYRSWALAFRCYRDSAYSCHSPGMQQHSPSSTTPTSASSTRRSHPTLTQGQFLRRLGEKDISHYRKEIMSIAWLVRTRPNIATAVAQVLEP